MQKLVKFCFFLLSIGVLGQVGISTTSPQAQLDINASNQGAPSNTDGVLIPRIDEFPLTNPTASQNGMMVFATGNGSVSMGFYFWDNPATSWVPFTTGGLDQDWLETGTGLVPNSITDNIYTEGNVTVDVGRVAFTNAALDANPTTGSGILELGGGMRLDANEIITGTGTTLFLQNDNQGDIRVDDNTLFIDGGQDRLAIGTLSPSSRLDIRATNQATPTNTDGFLVPRIDEFPATDPTSFQDGMMVFVTGNGTASRGLYYWTDSTSSWTQFDVNGNDHDWYEVGGSSPPNNILDDIFTVGNVGIGQTTANYPLDIEENQGGRGASVLMSGSTDNAGTGFYSTFTNSGDGRHNGIWTVMSGNGAGIHYGLRTSMTGFGSGTKYGLHAFINPTAGGTHYGVYSEATKAGSFAGYFNGDVTVINGRVDLTDATLDATDVTGTGILELGGSLRLDANEIITNTGTTLFLQNGNAGDLRVDNTTFFIDGTNNRVGLGTITPAYQLQLTTNSAAKPTSSAWTVASDARLKQNVRSFTDGLGLIQKINPVIFTYNGKAGTPRETGIGTLAQELQSIAPYMVADWIFADDEKGISETYLGVDYGPLQFVLVNAIKEQQAIIEDQEKRIQKLENTLEKLLNKERNQ